MPHEEAHGRHDTNCGGLRPRPTTRTSNVQTRKYVHDSFSSQTWPKTMNSQLS